MIFLLEFDERAQMEPCLLVLGAVLYFLDSTAGDLSDVYCEAQMLLPGRAVAHVPKGCRRSGIWLERGNTGLQHQLMWFRRQEGLPADPARGHP